MGYTHYWRNAKLDDGKWGEFTDAVGKILKNTDKVQRESDNPGKPEVDDEKVVFNGMGDDGHETFWFDKSGRGFDFCKTARKPYDEVVTACLIAAQIVFGEDITVTSDGSWAEWSDGAALYEKATGTTPTKFLRR